MTIDQIKEHFADQQVNRFDGPADDLAALHASAGVSYNYIVVADVIYFVSERPVADARIVAL